MRYLPLLLLLLDLRAPAQVWESLGGGFWPGSVNSLHRDETSGLLYAVGDFRRTNDDSTRMNGVGYWDGTDWHRMRDGINLPGNGAVDPAWVVGAYEDFIVVGGGVRIWTVYRTPHP